MSARSRNILSAVVALFAAVVVGFETASQVATLGYWLANVGVFVLSFLLVRYFAEPIDTTEVPPGQIPALRDAFKTSERNICAISSNWLDLWRTPSFIYYLHLNTSMSLINYTRGLGAPLKELSGDPKDQQAFYDKGLALADAIGGHTEISEYYVLRLLIYEAATYNSREGDVRALIQAHSLGRIHCIPVDLNKLETRLVGEEQRLLRDATAALQQRPEDKLAPPARILRALSAIGLRSSKSVATPDVVLIDLTPRGVAVAWSSVANRFRSNSADASERAANAFATICKHLRGALWDGYGADEIGLVPVTPDAFADMSEAFFSLDFYTDWIAWIQSRSGTGGSESARRLHLWLEAERSALKTLIKKGEVVLDVGAGYGRHAEMLLKTCGAARVIGVEINWSMLRQAEPVIRRLGLDDFVLIYGDAAELQAIPDASMDVAICMTNTLGNLVANKRNECVKSIARVLKPGGRAIFSVYNNENVSRKARKESYEAVNLTVIDTEDRIEAHQGLRSEHFTSEKLLNAVVKGSGDELQQLRGPDDLAGVGWLLVVERPHSDGSL